MANLFSKQIGKLGPFLAALDSAGLSGDKFEAVADGFSQGDNSLAVLMVSALAALGRKIEEAFVAFVNYLLQPSLDELRKAFGWVNDAYGRAKFEPIAACRDIDRTNRDVAFRYFRIKRTMTTKQILAAMDKAGLRPAMYEELLAFAGKYQDEQRKFPIVALGSVAVLVGGVRVAYLDENDLARDLNLRYDGPSDEWLGRYVFLAVSK